MNIQIYEDRHNIKFPNSVIKIKKRIGDDVYFETEFGLCKRNIYNIGRTNYNIHSAIYKTDFCIKQLTKLYGNKYDFSKVQYKNRKEKVLINCLLHGEFLMSLRNLLVGNLVCWGCNKQFYSKSHSHTIEKFIEKASKIHGDKYDYSEGIYKNSFTKVDIICKIHGKFTQNVKNHLNGSGCIQCGKIKLSESHSKNPTGWNLTNWIKKAKISKQFDSFKVYVIKCWNENEEFIKIGRTFNKLKQRFNGNNIPYKFEILQIFKGEAEEMYNLEVKLKRLNKSKKYLPLLKFNGYKECYSKVEYLN